MVLRSFCQICTLGRMQDPNSSRLTTIRTNQMTEYGRNMGHGPEMVFHIHVSLNTLSKMFHIGNNNVYVQASLLIINYLLCRQVNFVKHTLFTQLAKIRTERMTGYGRNMSCGQTSSNSDSVNGNKPQSDQIFFSDNTSSKMMHIINNACTSFMVDNN